MPTTIEQLELQVQSSSTSAVSGIDALSASLSKLKMATKGGVGLTSVANQVGNLDTALKSMDSGSADKIDKLTTSLEKLKNLGSIKISSSIGNQFKNIGQAASSLTGVDFSGISKLSQALQPLNSLGRASGLQSAITQLQKLPQLAQTLNGINWGTFTSQIQQLSSSLTPLVNQLNAVGNAFSRLPSNITRVVTATNRVPAANNRAATSYVDLWAKLTMAINAVKTGARVLASWITQSNQYIEDINLFTASMGQYAEAAKEYAEQVGEIMGIDPGEWMRNQGVFNTIISGFGVASDQAYLMSKNLTQLGYDISSFFNISFEDAMQKLQSGISGELEPLRRLGYDLSVARLQQEALNLGIEKSVSDMTQAEKSQLRYYAIMTQVTTAQGDMARTLNAPANQLRVLQAQVTQCARALGNIFIPALNAVLPYAIALVKVIRMVASAIASFFGFSLPEVDYSGISAGAGAVGDLANGANDATDGLGNAAKAAKKLKNATLGIDELNILSENDSSGSGGSGIGGGLGGGLGGSDLGIELPEYDFLGDLVNSKVDEIVKMITDAMNEITAVVSGFALAIGTILVVTGANIPLGLGLMAVGAVGLAATIAANWNTMSERLAKTLTLVTSILGGFLLAIGAFLVFSGVNVPLGAGLMVAGATALATAATINWKFLEGDLTNALSILTGIVSGALLAMGALFAFTGVSVPLGIALMAAGAVGLVTAVGLNWDSMSDPMRKAIGTLEAIVGGALLTFGAILALTGVNVPLGVGMIAAGAVSLVSAVALNWDSLTGDLKSSISTITAIVSGALIGIGAILALTGVATALGIAMIAAGAVGIVATAGLNWNSLTSKIKNVLKEIGIAVGAALIAVGAILALTGVALPLGVALIAAGAVSLVSGVALNWDSITGKIKEVLKKIGIIAGAAMLAIGAILCLTGVGIPLGVALIAAGAASLVSGVALNWDTIQTKVKEGLGKISEKFGEFKTAVGEKLEGAKEKITTWAGNVKEYFTKGADGKNAIDNIKEAASEWGESFKTGLSEKVSNAKSWVKEKITDPVTKAIKNSKAVEMAVGLKNNASELWEKAKGWWADATKDGLSLETGVELVKKGWTTVRNWVGNIPILDQGIKLAKHLWTSVKDWIGKIPILEQGIKLVKSLWTTVKGWIGNIPVVSQGVQLIKHLWTTVKGWIGNIPLLSQAIGLLRSGWNKVNSWVEKYKGGLVSQAITLAKSGWNSVSQWVRDRIGGAVDVTVNLISKWKGKIKEFFGLSGGGVVSAGGGIKMYSLGGTINSRGMSWWDSVPKYAGGTSKAHGSMFVAGESGAELVGHVNGTTEVLNRFQLAQVMHSSIVSGMAQFSGYWQSMSRDLVTCANGIINAVVVSTAGVNDNLVFASASGYDPYSTLAQSVYEDSKKSYDGAYSDDSWSRNMREFYHDYVEPTLKEIATDTKRQADKKEQTIVQVGNRTINDAVTTQKKANGYSFTE